MFRKILLTLLSLFILVIVSEAQMRRMYGKPRNGRGPQQRVKRELPRFKPTVNLSFGYGFPALDMDFLPEYYTAYRGDISQTGPVTGSLDYQFNRMMSIGVMVTYNKISAPYYDYYSSSADPVFTAKLDNWSFMLNITRYIPVSAAVISYIRTAIGFNSWTQTYTDPDGNRAPVVPADLPDFAYQAGIGARFNLSKNAGIFLEAGYGKYIAHGGLSLRF